MDNIRFFMKKNATDRLQVSITYNDTFTCYKYKYNDNYLIFKEYNQIEEDDNIELIYNKKKYNNFNDIQLILFEIFNYKIIEYIDIYLQKKIENT